MIYLLLFLLLFVTGVAGAALFYLWRFAKIILILENDFSEATDTLQTIENTLEDLLNIPMFFDSPDHQRLAFDAIETVKISKVSLAGLIRKFTQRSRQKYIEEIEDSKDN